MSYTRMQIEWRFLLCDCMTLSLGQAYLSTLISGDCLNLSHAEYCISKVMICANFPISCILVATSCWSKGFDCGISAWPASRFVLLRGGSGFYSYGIYERLSGWPAFSLNQTRITFKLSNDKYKTFFSSLTHCFGVFSFLEYFPIHSAYNSHNLECTDLPKDSTTWP